MRILYIVRITLLKTWGKKCLMNFLFLFGLQGVIWLRLHDARISIKINCICCFNKMTSVTPNRPNKSAVTSFLIHMKSTFAMIMLWRKHRISDNFLNSHQVSSYRHRFCEQLVFWGRALCPHTFCLSTHSWKTHSDNRFAVFVYNDAEAYFCLC